MKQLIWLSVLNQLDLYIATTHGIKLSVIVQVLNIVQAIAKCIKMLQEIKNNNEKIKRCYYLKIPNWFETSGKRTGAPRLVNILS